MPMHDRVQHLISKAMIDTTYGMCLFQESEQSKIILVKYYNKELVERDQ